MSTKVTFTIEGSDLDALLRICAALREAALDEELVVEQLSLNFDEELVVEQLSLNFDEEPSA